MSCCIWYESGTGTSRTGGGPLAAGDLHGWQELPGLPEVTFMHAVLLPNTNRILYWGYGSRADQTRLWDQNTGAYTQPVNQPQALAADENIWSAAHAHLGDAAGTVLLHGGLHHSANPQLVGGVEAPPDGGPAEIFDPQDPGSGFLLGPNVAHTRSYHSAAILLPDGTVIDSPASAACASAEGVRQPTIAGASWISPSFSRAATMNRAKSTRRVMLLARIGSPTCWLHTGRPWLSPSSSSLPRSLGT